MRTACLPGRTLRILGLVSEERVLALLHAGAGSGVAMFYYHGARSWGNVAAAEVALDPVPPELVGSLEWWRLRAAAAAKGARFTKSFRWLEDAELHQRMSAGAGVAVTAAKWLPHLEQLAEWGVCEWSDGGGEAKCRYFGVLKTERTSRSIVDCSGVSAACRREVERVHLLPIPLMLRRMARLVEDCIGRLGIWLGDLRHFFHQFGLAAGVRRHFLVAAGGRVAQWRVLPMGHTASTAVAQSATLAMLWMVGFRAPGAGMREAAGETDEEIPFYLVGGGHRGRGAEAYVWYDNVIALGPAADLVADERRFLDVARRFGAVLKYSQVYSGRALSREASDDEGTVALGVRVAVEVEKGPRGGKKRMFIRHAGEVVNRWRACVDRPVRSLRDLARLIGIVVYHFYVRSAVMDGMPQGPPDFVIEAARRLGRYRFGRKVPWEAPCRYSEAEGDAEWLKGMILRIVENPWSAVEAGREVTRYMATDASDTHWAGLLWSDVSGGPEPTRTVARRWTAAGGRGAHISVKEILAVLHALEAFASELQGQRVRIAIDALAIVHVLDRGASYSKALAEVVARIRKVCEGHQISISVVWVAGSRNAADVLTRPADPTEVAPTTEWVRQADRERLVWTLEALRSSPARAEQELLEAEESIEAWEREANEIDGEQAPLGPEAVGAGADLDE